MIKSIELFNFQSHKKTKIELCPGLNVLIGRSRSGKTSIMRGLRFVKDNRPSKNAFVSFWDRDEKKKNAPITEHYCSIVFTEGKEVKRIKTNNRNGYDILMDGKTIEDFDAVNKDVPDRITEIINMDDVNIQKQFDKPFMISDSNIEIARFLNKAIKLELIDEVLSKAEDKRIKTNRKYSDTSEEIGRLVVELGTLDWIDKAEALNELIVRRDLLIEKSMTTISNISKLLVDIQNVEELINRFPKNLDYVTKIIKDIEEIDSTSLIKQKTDLENILSNLNTAIKNRSKLLDLNTLNIYSSKILEIEKFEEQLSKSADYCGRLVTLISSIESQQSIIKQSILIKKQLEEQMPDTCPTCGKEW